MQIQNAISDLPGLEKEPAQKDSPAVRWQCRSRSLCSGITHYLMCFCIPRELAQQTVGSHRLQSEVSFLTFSLSLLSLGEGQDQKPHRAYSAEKVQLPLRKMFLAQSQLNLPSNSLMCTYIQTHKHHSCRHWTGGRQFLKKTGRPLLRNKTQCSWACILRPKSL